MEEEKQDEIVESSPTETDEIVESSTTEEEEPQVQEQEPEKGPIPYDRFEEKVRQQQDSDKRAEYWQQQAMDFANKASTPTQPQTVEPDLISKYGANDPGTREFLRDIDKHVELKANKIADTRASQLLRENEALKRSVATIQEKMFRQDNVDVPQGSQEETEIAQLIQMGVPLDKATWAVMGEKRVAGARRTGQTKQTNKVKNKVNANLERNTIASNSGLPQNEKLSFKEKMSRMVTEAGL